MAFLALLACPSFGQAALDTDEQTLARYTEILFSDPLRQGVFEKTLNLYQAGEGIEKLRKDAEARVAASPKDINPLVVLARLHEMQMRLADAVKCYDAALTVKPNDARLRLRLADLLAQQDDLGKAEGEYLKGLADLTDPAEQAKTFKKLGAVQMKRGAKDKAIASWAEMAKLQPRNELALLELAQVYEDADLLDEAVGAHRQIITLAAANPYRQCQSWRAMGLVQLKQGKRAEAIGSFGKALSLTAPGNWLYDELWRRIAAAHLDAGDVEGLIALLGQKLTGGTGDALIRELLVEAHMRKGDVQAADRHIAQLVDGAGDRVDVYEKAISLYERTRNLQGVRRVCEKLVTLRPKDVEHCRRLGEVCVRLGDAVAAEKAWMRIVEADPTDASRRMLVSEIFWKHEMRDRAIAELRRLAASQPKLVETQLRLGEMIFQRGDHAQAKATWLKLAEALDTPADLVRVAQVLEDRQLTADAIPVVQKAVRLDEANPENRRNLA
ncbi:MAG: tetratricopeptide repeat protein, partial [Planctomycetes bacterium]|nr:tetratricopeptide repeat protein [Planctomycetota bacterium]